MSEPKSFKQMWSQWDELKAKSKNEFETTKEEIAKLDGWKFKGVEDGLTWTARHQKEAITITARTGEDLVNKVRAKRDAMQEAERKRADDEAKRKGGGK